ncbi:hypothetical protein F4779DRAFT_592562 [Xylariaceae sp. FL0662B]|nr:hypothetical protein F4779DRAFT_592562 [Xylariaceae sp. FL0662B]
MLSNSIFVLALAATAAARPAEEVVACPHTKCVDALNDCGVKYGGCFDECAGRPPSPPPCEVTPRPVSATSVSTTCVDSLRTCGDPPTAILTFGGCFPAGGPTPTFSAPPCPTPEITDAPATADAAEDDDEPCDGATKCMDWMRKCGTTATLMYGACFPPCMPTPMIEPPPCPTPEVETTTEAVGSPSPTVF